MGNQALKGSILVTGNWQDIGVDYGSAMSLCNFLSYTRQVFTTDSLSFVHDLHHVWEILVPKYKASQNWADVAGVVARFELIYATFFPALTNSAFHPSGVGK